MKVRGIDIRLHPDEALSNHIRRTGDFFEAEILDYLATNHPIQGTVVDVGANIGNHSLFFLEFMHVHGLVAFEPVPENYVLLVENLTGHDNITMVQYAVGRKQGAARIKTNYGNMGASEVSDEGSVEVPMVSLDSFLGSYIYAAQDISLVKIDVEGYEPEVIDGAQDTIYICKPLILIEDWKKEYGSLLPGYVLEKGWDHHHTYLYRYDA